MWNIDLFCHAPCKSLFCYKSWGWVSMGATGAIVSTKFENWILVPMNCQLASSLKLTTSYVSTHELKFLMQLWKCTWQIKTSWIRLLTIKIISSWKWENSMLVVFNVNVLSLSMNETQPFLTIFEYEINVVITNRSLGENGKEKVLKKNQ